MAGRRLVAATPPLVLTIRAAQVAPADPADPVITPVARVAQVDPAITPVAQVDLVDLVDPAIIRADLVDLADPAIIPVVPAITQVVRAARGTGTPSVVTSTGHRGAMGLAPGGLASRRGRHGIDRSPRLMGAGTTARSITGVTTKRRIGTPVSTSGDLTSSECGSRCDQ